MVPVLLVCQKRTQSGLKLKGKKIIRLSHVHAVYKAIIQWLLALNLMHKSSYGFLICAKDTDTLRNNAHLLHPKPFKSSPLSLEDTVVSPLEFKSKSCVILENLLYPLERVLS